MSVLTPALGSSLSSGEVRHGVRCQRCKVTAFVLQRTKKPGQLGPRCCWQLWQLWQLPLGYRQWRSRQNAGAGAGKLSPSLARGHRACPCESWHFLHLTASSGNLLCALVTLVHIFHSNFCEISHRVELDFFLSKKVKITFYGTLERSGGRAGPGQGPCRVLR